MSSLTLKTHMQRPCRLVSKYWSDFGLPFLLLFALGATALPVCAQPPDFSRFGGSDTTAAIGQRPDEGIAPSLATPGAEIGYPLDPIPVPADSQWWDGFSRPGVSGTVRAMTLFEGDLAVGGGFTTAGKVRAVEVARWDGAAWAEIGGTLEDVRSLAVYDGRLVAGRLGYCGEQIIKVWDGDSWENLGAGLINADHYCWGISQTVFALAVYNGNLVAGGDFWESDTINPDSYLARWDGETWSPLGSGPVSGPDRNVYSMTVYDDNLIIGGFFREVAGVEAPRIAAWDGSSWSSLGVGIDNDIEYGSYVLALTVYEGKLYAGGIFNRADTLAVDRLACWDGVSWSSTGFEAGGNVDGSSSAVFALAVYDGKLIAGGRFNKAKGALGDFIAAWDGASWEELGSGLSGIVYSLIPYGDVLIAGGAFKFAGDQVVYNIAIWDGEAWHPLGSGQGLQNRARTLAVHNEHLVAGGEFTIAGDTPANLVAEWDGAGWHPMDEGWSWVRAGDLISAGGEILGKHGRVVKRWNEISWEDYTTDFGEDIYTIASYGGRLVASGGKVAEWDGASWLTLGSVPSGYVAALLEAGGDLIAGGRFTAIGGTAARNVARWDGSAWSAMGDGLRYNLQSEEEVSALGLFDGEIVAGGHFNLTGEKPVNHIARWDGEEWQPLYKGVVRDTGTKVFCLGVYNGTLIAAGDFRWAGDIRAWNIARWNGSSWSPLGYRGL
jgi:hypothetical protein